MGAIIDSLPRPGDPGEHWLVIWSDSSVRWLRFLKPGFRHVAAYRYDPATDQWCRFEMGLDGMRVGPVGKAEVEHAVGRMTAGLWWTARPHLVPVGRPWLTCVSVIEHLLGLPGCAVTPWRLWVRLQRALDRGV